MLTKSSNLVKKVLEEKTKNVSKKNELPNLFLSKIVIPCSHQVSTKKNQKVTPRSKPVRPLTISLFDKFNVLSEFNFLIELSRDFRILEVL